MKLCTFRQVYGAQEPLEKRYARMAALHQVSFKFLAESQDVREGFEALGLKPLKSPDKVAR